MNPWREYDEILHAGPKLLGVPATPLVALVLANLIPLAGVIFFGWDLRGVMLLYWVENVVVGGWAIVRMLVIGRLWAVPTIMFFCLHFGMFMFVHLIFVYALTEATDWSAIEWQGSASFTAPSKPDASFFPSSSFWSQFSWIGCLALVASHGISFFRNFLAGGEWRRSSLGAEMGRPYPRMLVMHLAILGGGFAIGLLGQPLALLAVLVILKILVDSAAHVVEHRLAAASDEKAGPEPPEPGGDGRDDRQQHEPAGKAEHRRAEARPDQPSRPGQRKRFIGRAG